MQMWSRPHFKCTCFSCLQQLLIRRLDMFRPRPVQKRPAGPNKGSAGPEGTSPCPFCGLDLIQWTDEWLWTWGCAGCPSLSLLSAVLTIVRGGKKTLLRPFCFEHQRCARAPLKSLRHSEITLWRTSCTRARVRKIEWDKEKRELQQKWQECSANWKARGERERRRKTERREERWAKRQFKSRKEQRE